MNQNDIRAVLIEELGNVAPELTAADIAAIADDADLREALDIDSISLLNFIIALHKRLTVEIPEIDYPKLVTKKGALNYLSARLG
jgi:acyl carrier protein